MALEPNSYSARLRVSDELLNTPILVIDDVQDNRDLLEEMLVSEGYGQIVQAPSGPEGLEVLRARSDIGLVLLDLMMPVMDGYEVCERITGGESTSHIPVIVVTGGALRRDDALIKSFARGAIDFLPKPVNEVELYGRVKAALILYHERVQNRAKTRALVESQMRYDLAVNGVNDGIWDFDLAEKSYYFSPKWKEMLGYLEEELPNDNGTWDELMHPDDRSRVQAAIQEHWEKRTPYYTIEHRLRTKTGEYKWVFSRGRAIWNDRGEVTRMAGSTTDITQRKHLETQLRQAQQLESIGRLAAGVAHDFNNLLTTILGQASLGRLRLAPDSPVQVQFDRIERASLQAANFCKQMLAYAGQGRYSIERLDINALVRETSELIGISISKKVALRFDLSTTPVHVEADTAQVRQVLLNLLLNGAEAIGEGAGSITIRTSAVRAGEVNFSDAVLAPPNPSGEYVLLEIADTGCGMSQQTQDKIFEPFFTTKFTGRGLGLSAVLGIVKAHDGALKVQSSVGTGTTFRLYLPKTDAPELAGESGAALPAAWRGSGTILLIDDESGVREVYEGLLREMGFQVLLAEDGLRGVELFQAHQKDIAAIILDLNMPNLSGEETFERIRNIEPAVKVLLASGYTEQEAIRRFAGRGIAGFLQKPFRYDDLGRRLRHCLAQQGAGAGECGQETLSV